MTGAVHGGLARFLRGESRQVWALDRFTGEPFYLPDGQADALRNYARASLKCPHPECAARISTRGGDKRHHFWHPGGTPHENSRESENHLAGKAMLVQWARPRIPEGAVVEEEKSVKDPETHALRRPDVLVTGQTGRRVAFEVEYKDWEVEAWRHKQDDLDRHGIVTVWLFGSTRISGTPDEVSAYVGVPRLAAQIARAQHPVFVLNPSTRQVGTLAGAPDFTRRYTGHGTGAWLAIDPIEECEFSPSRGLVTPTSRRIEAGEAARDQQEAVARARTAGHDAAVAAEQQRERRRQRALDETWEASPLHTTFLGRWGRVPEPFLVVTAADWAIQAAPAHWRAVVYEDLIAGRTTDFKWRDVFLALDRHRIARSASAGAVFNVLDSWLGNLQRLGLVLIHRDRSKRVLLFSPTGRTLDETPNEARTGQEATRAAPAARKEAHRPRSTPPEDRRTRLIIHADGRRQWIAKHLPDPPGTRRASENEI